ncbi:MAG: hypothetical protein ACMV0F_08055 [Trichlorobacter sp.]
MKEQSTMYDIELSKKREEVYLYLVEQLTKANERPSPLVAKEMTDWLMDKFSLLSSDIERGGIVRLLGKSSQQVNVLAGIKEAIGSPEK